jgi:UDP-N-acetylglucosamine acyltransferase
VSIHPTAIVASSAVVPESCSVGPYSTIGPDVVLGEDCELVSHVILDGHLTVGARNRVFPFASVGVAPQDLKYKNEPTRCEVGADTVVRESVTNSRGKVGGGGVTRIGANCLIMAYAHIGHDSQIGNHCILANAATLAGHVIVEDYATVGALCPVHQYCRIGKYSFVGGGTTITQDVLPFSLTSAKRETHAFGLNKIGLERRGFTRDQLKALQHAYRLLLAARLNTSQAVERLRAEGFATGDVAYLVEFVEQSQRGVLK